MSFGLPETTDIEVEIDARRFQGAYSFMLGDMVVYYNGHTKSVRKPETNVDEIAIDMWNLYKGRPPYKGDEEGRASDFTQCRSAGADDCAEAIRKRNNT